ncbi:hypothetical protein ABTW95_03960 [Spirillospora sp. NPDC127506]
MVSLPARRIVESVDVGQSTVSAHLKVPADTRGTARFYRINDEGAVFAADAIMGRPAPQLARARPSEEAARAR